MNKKFLSYVLLLNLFISPVIGQVKDTLAPAVILDTILKSYRLFEDQDLLEVTLRFDRRSYFRTRPKATYLKTNITLFSNTTDSVSSNIKLRTRGVFRNQHCVFPPIELNFKRADFGYSDLDRTDKIKLVVQCKPTENFKNYLLKEYLVYKLYNVISDASFRVRLVNVTYVDSERKRKAVTHFGFFIEPLELLLERTNSVRVDSRTLTQKSIVQGVMDKLAIFEYMIGNYDWAVPGQHNIRVIRPVAYNNNEPALAVPFDFDWTGMVNASYAVPEEKIGTQSVRERIFFGVCRSRDVFERELAFFIQKKDEFYRVINEFPYLDQKGKRDITGYLDEFFNQLTGKSDIIEYMLESCKNF